MEEFDCFDRREPAIPRVKNVGARVATAQESYDWSNPKTVSFGRAGVRGEFTETSGASRQRPRVFNQVKRGNIRGDDVRAWAAGSGIPMQSPHRRGRRAPLEEYPASGISGRQKAKLSSRMRNIVLLLASSVALVCIAGCSLFSLNSPERPLSTRDLNARMLTREYSVHFIGAIEQSADAIAANEQDPMVLDNALRWKISASRESQRAAAQMSPMVSLLDTWTLSEQMQIFLSDTGAGRALFGSHQEAARAIADNLAADAEAMAHRVVASGELVRYQAFVAEYTRDHPLESLTFKRASVLDLWSRQSGADVRLVDTLGTVPEATADLAQRMQMYGETVPSQTIWKTQLALRESGYSGGDLRAALAQLDSRLARVSAAADTAPDLVHDAVADVRTSMLEVIERLNASSAEMVQALRTERAALSDTVSTEREAVLGALDTQRKEITIDAAGIAEKVVRSSGQEARYLAREVLLLLILLTVIVLGLPFAAGYYVGRVRRHREST
jgi:hypothetical protein